MEGSKNIDTPISSQYLDDHIEYLDKLYKDEKVIEAFAYFKFLEEGIFSGDILFKSMDEEKSDYENFLAFPVISKINYDQNLYYRCIETYKNCFSKTPSEVKDGAKLWWIKEEDTKSMTTVGSVEIKASLLKCLSILRDKDLNIQTYNFESVDNIKILSHNRNITSTVVKLPSPFEKRQVVTYCIYFKDEDSGVMMYKSSKEDAELFDYKDVSTLQEIKVNFGFSIFKRINDNLTSMITGSNIEYNLTGVPDLVMNNIIKELSQRGLSIYKKLMEDPENDKILEKKLIEDKDFLSNFKQTD